MKNMPQMAINKHCEASVVSNEKAKEHIQEYLTKLKEWKNGGKGKQTKVEIPFTGYY